MAADRKSVALMLAYVLLTVSYTRPISAQQLTPEQRQTVAVEVMTNGAVRNCEAVRQELLTSPDSSLNKARVLSAKQLQVLSTLNCQQQAEYFEQHRIRTWVRAQAVASLQATFPCFNTTAVKDALTSVAWYYLTALASMADDTMRRTLATASEADCLRMLNTVLVPLQNNDTLQNGKLGFGVPPSCTVQLASNVASTTPTTAPGTGRRLAAAGGSSRTLLQAPTLDAANCSTLSQALAAFTAGTTCVQRLASLEAPVPAVSAIVPPVTSPPATTLPPPSTTQPPTQPIVPPATVTIPVTEPPPVAPVAAATTPTAAPVAATPIDTSAPVTTAAPVIPPAVPLSTPSIPPPVAIPTEAPTTAPTAVPTAGAPTEVSTAAPTTAPTAAPTEALTATAAPTTAPLTAPTPAPTTAPATGPTTAPTTPPTTAPTASQAPGVTTPPAPTVTPSPQG
eukprot:jgi/Chrzof1/14411/Cz09g01160.t1